MGKWRWESLDKGRNKVPGRYAVVALFADEEEFPVEEVELNGVVEEVRNFEGVEPAENELFPGFDF